MLKPIEDLSDDELREGWEDGNWLASQGSLSPEHEKVLEEIEREMTRRAAVPS